MANEVIVKDSTPDMELLYKQFPNLRHNARRGAFGPAPNDPNRLPFEPEVESMDYVPPPGQSTYRGSRALIEEGTPADVVRREYYSHLELINGKPRIFHPEVLNKVDKSRINFDTGPISGAPPKQSDYFTQTEEGQRMIAQHKRMITPKGTVASPNPAPPVLNPTPDVAPPPPASTMIPDPSVLPPMEKPWNPSSEDIVKVLGYNETNMKLLTEVSKRMSICGELLRRINSAHESVDVDELMLALQHMDNVAFRTIFADIFQKEMTKYMTLSNEIQSYLNGTAEIETPETQEENTEAESSAPTSAGNVHVISADSSQNTSDQSALSGSETVPSGQSSESSSQATS